MLASRTLTPGAADAVSIGSNLGLYTQPVARAPVASDTGPNRENVEHGETPLRSTFNIAITVHL